MANLLANKTVLNGILGGVLLLFSAALWFADNFLIGFSSLVAILGWVAWWQEKTTDDEGEAEGGAALKPENAPSTSTSPLASTAMGEAPTEVSGVSETEAPSEGNPVSDSEGETPQTTKREGLNAPLSQEPTYGDTSALSPASPERAEWKFSEGQPEPGTDFGNMNLLNDLKVHPLPTPEELERDISEVSLQISTARIEADTAVGVAIQSFGKIVEQAKQLEECSREVAGWQDAANPLRQDTVEYLVQCSQELGASVNQLVMAFQFNDLLSQRLSHTENSLDHLKGRVKGEKRSSVRKSISFADGPVDYGVQAQEEEMVTLF